jgi:hypothetical protein
MYRQGLEFAELYFDAPVLHGVMLNYTKSQYKQAPQKKEDFFHYKDKSANGVDRDNGCLSLYS